MSSVAPRLRRGSRARMWTDEEETYLLQSRNQRLPYRRIASYLKKSELACRLHYHQITVIRQRSLSDAIDDPKNTEWVQQSSLPISQHHSASQRAYSPVPQVKGLQISEPFTNELLSRRSESISSFRSTDLQEVQQSGQATVQMRKMAPEKKQQPTTLHLPQYLPAINNSDIEQWSSTQGHRLSERHSAPPMTPITSTVSSDALPQFESSPKSTNASWSMLATPETSPRGPIVQKNDKGKCPVSALLNYSDGVST